MPELTPYTNQCQCGGCGLFFSTVRNFDRHRVGIGEKRRCRSPIELTEMNMHVNQNGFWAENPKGRMKKDPAAGRSHDGPDTP